MTRSFRPIIVAILLAAATAADASASAGIEPVVVTRSATNLAQAMSGQRGLVTSASFSAVPPWSNPAAIATTELAGFPTPSAAASGRRFAILSTGDATLAGRGNDSTFTGREAGGPSIRGGLDVTIVRISLRVPKGANCLQFDVRLLSDEYKEAIGTQYGDAFLAEVDTSNWQAAGPPSPGISAPFNIARDMTSPFLTITKTGLSAMTPAAARGTTYDGATGRIRVAAPTKPGSHLLYLSIFDRGDRVYDTAAFVDNLQATNRTSCRTRIAKP